MVYIILYGVQVEVSCLYILSPSGRGGKKKGKNRRTRPFFSPFRFVRARARGVLVGIFPGAPYTRSRLLLLLLFSSPTPGPLPSAPSFSDPKVLGVPLTTGLFGRPTTTTHPNHPKEIRAYGARREGGGKIKGRSSAHHQMAYGAVVVSGADRLFGRRRDVGCLAGARPSNGIDL